MEIKAAEVGDQIIDNGNGTYDVWKKVNYEFQNPEFQKLVIGANDNVED